MKSICQKVGHKQLFDVNKNVLARALQNTFSSSSVFFFSLYQITKEFLAFVKATILTLVISITYALFSVD